MLLVLCRVCHARLSGSLKNLWHCLFSSLVLHSADEDFVEWHGGWRSDDAPCIWLVSASGPRSRDSRRLEDLHRYCVWRQLSGLTPDIGAHACAGCSFLSYFCFSIRGEVCGTTGAGRPSPRSGIRPAASYDESCLWSTLSNAVPLKFGQSLAFVDGSIQLWWQHICHLFHCHWFMWRVRLCWRSECYSPMRIFSGAQVPILGWLWTSGELCCQNKSISGKDCFYQKLSLMSWMLEYLVSETCFQIL